MSDLIETIGALKDGSPESIREGIMFLEKAMRQHPEVKLNDSDLCPVQHFFAPGIYVREIFIPAGAIVVGKIHKHIHPNFLMYGIVDVVTEFGCQRLQGPHSMISEAGTKRALHAITDLVWVTVHHNPDNITDIPTLEDLLIAKSYEEFESTNNIIES